MKLLGLFTCCLPAVLAGMGWQIVVRSNMDTDLEISAGEKKCWNLGDFEQTQLIVREWSPVASYYTEQDNTFMACDEVIFETQHYLTLNFKSLSYLNDSVPVHLCKFKIWHRTSNFYNYCNVTNERCFGDFSFSLDKCGDTVGGERAQSTFIFNRIDQPPLAPGIKRLALDHHD